MATQTTRRCSHVMEKQAITVGGPKRDSEQNITVPFVLEP